MTSREFVMLGDGCKYIVMKDMEWRLCYGCGIAFKIKKIRKSRTKRGHFQCKVKWEHSEEYHKIRSVRLKKYYQKNKEYFQKYSRKVRDERSAK